jgi:hypothetical protein
MEPALPCTHSAPCAMSRSKWCHFAFDTEDAPAALHRLSAAAGIPKKRAVLSFLLTGPQAPGGAPAPAPVPSGEIKRRRDTSAPAPGGEIKRHRDTSAPGGEVKRRRVAPPPSEIMPVRVISDMFSLPPAGGAEREEWGRYGCAEKGLILITGDRDRINRAASGAVITLDEKRGLPEKRDRKSGALRMSLRWAPQ